MQLFFTQHIEGDFAYLPEDEARHCVQVLRKKEGQQIQFTDGKGGWYTGVIVETTKKSCVLSILSHQSTYNPPIVNTHIAIAPTKNMARMEWFVEKATEIGISSITPILCQQSERKKIRIDRLEKIALAAMKQSLKAYLPKIDSLVTFKEFVAQKQDIDVKYIAYCDYENNVHLQEKYQAGQNVLILIGPEGDFSTEEVEWAKKEGFIPIGLGKNRLRTETAGIAACHIIQLMNE